MANPCDPIEEARCLSFSDFPDDVQLCILSFLGPSDVSSFSRTSKRFVSLLHNDSIWYAMCDRRWGSKTNIKKWGSGKIRFKLLYETLIEYENLVGFWRRSGERKPTTGGSGDNFSPLVLFEWGPTYVTGSRVSPSKGSSYDVIKSSFIWMSISAEGAILNYLDPNCKFHLSENAEFSGKDLIQISISFIGKGHVVVEESREFGIRGGNSGSPETSGAAGNGYRRNGSYANLSGDDLSGVEIENVMGTEIGSPPERLMSQMYQYFANRTSPGASGERAWRRQRRRERERERQGRRKWEAEHLVKIVNCSPTPSRPLQGLWKGICDDMSLDFYLVVYDDLGGIACRRVGDSSKPFSGYAPVFWTSDAKFIEAPLSHEEDYIYNTHMHLRPNEIHDDAMDVTEYQEVSRIMYINSSYDIVIPDLAMTSANPRRVEGRIWQYVDGTFGFGFLRDNFIVDLKHIAQNGHLLDTIELYGD